MSKHTLKKIFHKFSTQTLAQKVLLILISSIFLFLFAQNFIFSESFDILMLRNVDDFAFQKSLRDNHNDLLQFHIFDLFKLYNYGYGWLFWIIHTLFTFPFYFLTLIDIDFPLIAMARDISLFFMAGGCFFLFKIIKKYTSDKNIPYLAVLLFMSFPFFAYSAMSFRTVAQGSFFCILTFYLLIRNDVLTNKDLKYVAISLAACIGTKISNAIFLPLVAIFLIDRLQFKINKENLSKAFYFLKYFLPLSVFFSNPSLFLAPFKWALFTKYQAVMNYYFNLVKTNQGNALSFYENLKKSFFEPFLDKYILIMVLVFFIIKITNDLRRNEKHKLDFLYIFIFLILSTLYLNMHVKMGFFYTASYIFSFSFLLLLSLVIIDKFPKSLRILSLILIFSANIILNYFSIKNNNLNCEKIYTKAYCEVNYISIDGREYIRFIAKLHSDEMQEMLKSQKEMQKIVGSPKQNLSILIDYRAPVIYSNFRKNINMLVIFDNIGELTQDSTKENQSFDYILLHKDSKMLIKKNIFDTEFNTADPALKKTWNESRELIEILLKNGNFRNHKYKIVYETEKLILLQKLL